MPAKKSVAKAPEGIENVLEQIRQEFGEGAIMRLGGSEDIPAIPVVSTGSFTLDNALGVNGLPRGRVVEIYGPESSGKTTLVLHVIRNAQRNGRLPVSSLNPPMAGNHRS